jgi:peptidoglycan/xylan/chitin deacetylase (PgdA/CDA1 family)
VAAAGGGMQLSARAGIMMAGAPVTDNVNSALRESNHPRAPEAPLPLAILHRRRRASALAALAALALLIGLVMGAARGGARAHRPASLGTGYVADIRRLADRPGQAPRGSATDAENDAVDRTLAYTPYVRMAGSQHREIALTFDDGPGPYTPAILAVLERMHVPATFFEVGVLETYFHAATAAIVARGDPIGDHTEDHAAMSRLSAKQQEAQLLEQTAAIGDYGARFPRLFRPPYGLWDGTTLRLLKRFRMLMVLWSVDTDDYLQPGVKVIVDRALDGASPGAIILLHDAGGNRSETVAALPEIIRGLRRRGYKLVTVPRLLLDNPAPARQNVYTLAGGGG